MGADAISLDQLKTNQEVQTAVGTAQEQLIVRMNGKDVPESVALNQQTESVLREQLIDLKVIEPDQFESLLDRHFAGTNALLDTIMNSPVLKKNYALQKSLYRAAIRMRKKGERNYRLYRLTQEDMNVGSLDDRLGKINETIASGFPITLAINGASVKTRLLRFHGQQCILRDQSNPKKFIVLDRAAKAVTYRDDSGEVQDVQLTSPNMITLNPGNTFSKSVAA